MMTSENTTETREILIPWSLIITVVASFALGMLAAWLLRAHLDWYPAMGVHAVNITAFHHYVFAGWVQTSPGHVAFRFGCYYLG